MCMICLLLGILDLTFHRNSLIISIVGNLPSSVPWKKKLPVHFCFWMWQSSRKDLQWTPKSTENPHTQVIISISNRITHHMWKQELSTSSYHRSTTIYQELQDRSNEIDILRHGLQLSAYPIGFIDSVINRSKRSDCLKEEIQPLDFISIIYKCFWEV
jgi:hypothetical protein